MSFIEKMIIFFQEWVTFVCLTLYHFMVRLAEPWNYNLNCNHTFYCLGNLFEGKYAFCKWQHVWATHRFKGMCVVYVYRLMLNICLPWLRISLFPYPTTKVLIFFKCGRQWNNWIFQLWNKGQRERKLEVCITVAMVIYKLLEQVALEYLY